MKVVRKEIDVLCWFDQQGYPNPVRFRIIDETKSQQVIKIDKVVTREFEKLIVIKYELESCRWILFKY